MTQTRQVVPIQGWVEQTVLRLPQSTAVIHDDQQLTYRQLNERANQLAHYLRLQGAGPDQLIGVCLERSCDLIIALLAILKAGSAYLPLDLSYPTARLGYMLNQAQAPLLLTQTRYQATLPKTDARVICLDEIGRQLEALPTQNLTSTTQPEHLAYLIYTSGSTGQPKGVAMPHRSLANLLQWQLRSSHAGAGSRTLQFTPVSFDVSFQEIFGTFCSGGTLVLIDEVCRKDPFKLLQYIGNQHIERLFLPFVALRQLAEAGAIQGSAPQRLTEVITAGEQLRITPEIVRWFEAMPRCSLHNHYGPSETHVVTALQLTGNPRDWPALPSIGYPIDQVQAYLLDTDKQPVAAGEVGELYFGGSCLAKGYLHRPEITSERFISNPFSPGRLYRTGDLGRRLPTGEIEDLGRLDQQVKIRGYRIEPAEIEAQLEDHCEIQEAIVIAKTETDGTSYLVGYLLTDNDQTVTSRELQQFLLERLPDYMVPAHFVTLPTWPLTPSGKVDRKALAQITPAAERNDIIPPATQTEQQVAQLWQDLLHHAAVSRDATFFELGGDSLKAVQMLYRLEQVTQQYVSLAVLLEHPRLDAFCNQIDQLLALGDSSSRVAVEISLDPAILPQRPAVFLTGATGNLGGALLASLLSEPHLEVHCLLRGEQAADCLDRLRESLEQQRLWQADFEGRIIPVIGDLSQPSLGLSEADFQALGERISVIYHSGAWVNLAYPYQVLKQSNVDSLTEILRLASYRPNLPIHFVSTVDVWVTLENQVRTVDVTTPAGPMSQLPNGYAQSKYIAEQLLDIARERGFAIAIYRPSNIIGHHLNEPQQAHFFQDTFIAKMLKGCIQMGCAPKISAALNLISAEQVHQPMLSSLQSSQVRQTLPQLAVNPLSCSWEAAIALLNQQGYSLSLIPHEQWFNQLSQLEARGQDTELTPLLAMLQAPDFLQTVLGGFEFPHIDVARTETNAPPQASHPATMAPIPSSTQLLSQYCDALMEQGYLPLPQDCATLGQFVS